MAGRTARHNRAVLNLGCGIARHLDGSGCQVFTQSMKVWVADGILYPDVVVTCDKAWAGDEQIVSDPKLVLEVLSTKGYDQRHKFDLYRSLPSLQEYALIDPVERGVEVFTLIDGAWGLVDQKNAGVLTLRSIDLTMSMGVVFKGIDQIAG